MKDLELCFRSRVAGKDNANHMGASKADTEHGLSTKARFKVLANSLCPDANTRG